MGIDTLLAPVDVGVEFLPMRKGLLQHKASPTGNVIACILQDVVQMCT